MSKEKFSWKGLFLNEEGNENKTPEREMPKSNASSNTFPESKSTVASSASRFPESTANAVVGVNDAVLQKIIEMYESGFESLNKPGYDFYEFFKAIKAVGSNDPSIYKMALTMASSVDESVSKASLLKQADFYIEEIEKVHKKYKIQGAAKKDQILGSQKAEKSTLTTEISSLEKQLMEIQHQISTKKNQLQAITSNSSDVIDIDQKIMANDTAKSKILETILQVVDGIKNNL
ncbi:hypothetical protein [Lacinutrix mariniflava]|uniref:hypothetical protein n=1 Tax=Lacinutrix mariniflava TaxID=342955 RepID=UPI0006E1E672|nr:hypothetical protein [Lacinutrix mariniflava]